MTPPPTVALEACPFCGGEPISHGIEPHTHQVSFGGFTMPDHKGSHVIECSRCECGMIADTQLEAVAAWNQRHVATPKPVECETASREPPHCPTCECGAAAPADKAVSDVRLRNTRAWAQARVGQLSGADVIVAACDEALAARDLAQRGL